VLLSLLLWLLLSLLLPASVCHSDPELAEGKNPHLPLSLPVIAPSIHRANN